MTQTVSIIRLFFVLTSACLLLPCLSILSYGDNHAIFQSRNMGLLGLVYVALVFVWIAISYKFGTSGDHYIQNLKIARTPRWLRLPITILVLSSLTIVMIVFSKQMIFIQVPSLVITIYMMAISLLLLVNSRQIIQPSFIQFLFTLILLIYLPFLIIITFVLDANADNLVLAGGDEHEYQRLAVNLLYGNGYTNDIVEPLEEYHLTTNSDLGRGLQEAYGDGQTVTEPTENFYRAPGWSLFLSVIYRIVGNNPLNARLSIAILSWLTALLIFYCGIRSANLVGTVAGALGGILFLHHQVLVPPSTLQELMTEPLATFLITLTALLILLYKQSERYLYFLLSAIALCATIYTRSNFVVVIPFLVLYYFVTREKLLNIFIYCLIIAIPIVIWGTYATTKSGELIFFTTQSEIAFPQFNNEDVLTGFGPDRFRQGSWQPGYRFDADGNRIEDSHNVPKEGENGWVMGLTYWRDNPEDLPALFYVKLRAGLWTNERDFAFIQATDIGRIQALGIIFTLFGLGLHRQSQSSTNRKRVVWLQLSLAVLTLVVWGKSLFWLVLLLYLAIALIAIFAPYREHLDLKMPTIDWYLAFILGHVVVTLLFGGLTRFHQPLDPFLTFLGLIGYFAFILYALSNLRGFNRLAPFMIIIRDNREATPIVS